jgi:hypothetical protein
MLESMQQPQQEPAQPANVEVNSAPINIHLNLPDKKRGSYRAMPQDDGSVLMQQHDDEGAE